MLERRALLALSYPRAQDFADSDERSVRSLVAWLENMKIRLYPTEERQALEKVEDPAWDHAFAKYLADLECPLPPPAAASGANGGANGSNGNNGAQTHAAALRWLLTLALSLDYRDSAAELNVAGAEMEQEARREEEAAAARVAEAAAKAGDDDSGAAAAAAARRRLAVREQAAAGVFSDLDAPQVRAEIDRLLRMLRLDGGGGGGAEEGGAGAGAPPSAPASTAKGEEEQEEEDPDDLARLERRLAAARRAVADEVLPTVGSSASSAGPAAASAASCASLLAGVPLGFATGDARVDEAGALLRLLYLRDLRALQSAVDAAVVEAQEYTANPRTDASLGRVGR